MERHIAFHSYGLCFSAVILQGQHTTGSFLGIFTSRSEKYCLLSLSLPPRTVSTFLSVQSSAFFSDSYKFPFSTCLKTLWHQLYFPILFPVPVLCFTSHHITSAMLDLAVGLISTGHSGRKDFSRVQIAQHSSKKLTNIPKTQTSLLMPQYKVWWEGGVF